MGNLHCKLAIRDLHYKLVIGHLHCKVSMGGLHCKVSMGGLCCKLAMGSLHCKLAMGGLHCKLAMGALQKKLKERCYLDSVQHSYENRSCKPEIKYFSSVKPLVYRCKPPVYSGLQWITFVKKGVTSTVSSTVMRIWAVNLKLSTFQV